MTERSVATRVRTRLVCLLLVAATGAFSGCLSHSHRVGLGATGADREEARQYYMFFGLARLNTVEVGRMTEDLTSYDIETWFSWVDLAISPLLLPLTITSRTVRVSR